MVVSFSGMLLCDQKAEKERLRLKRAERTCGRKKKSKKRVRLTAPTSHHPNSCPPLPPQARNSSVHSMRSFFQLWGMKKAGRCGAVGTGQRN